MSLRRLIENLRLSFAAFVIAVPALSTAANADVKISSNPTANMSCSGGVCTPTAKKAVLNIADLADMLASGNATIKTNDIAQDIEIDDKLSWASTNRLTLDAYRTITFNNPVQVMGAGAVTITTNDGGTDGDYRFLGKGRLSFSDSHSSLVINGNSYRLYSSLKGLIRELKDTGGAGLYLAQSGNWNVKQSWSAPPINKQFSGTFEGLGNAISNLVINDTTTGHAGLFETIFLDGLVRDLRIENATVSANESGGARFLGVLAGYNQGTIINCFVSGQVSGNGSGSLIGGIVGGNLGLISRSGSAVTVLGNNGESVGGLVGENQSGDTFLGDIDQSYATGAVTGGDGAMVGGLVGYNFGTIVSNSYAAGTVTGGNNAFAGGLIGTSADNTDADWIPAVSTSYSTGVVTGGSGAMIGGLTGQDAADAHNANDYWDLDTSGIGDPGHGAGNIENDPGITGLSDAQLKSGLPAGFDDIIWSEKAKLNGGYPYLGGNTPPK